jgi:hypothetical protein
MVYEKLEFWRGQPRAYPNFGPLHNDLRRGRGFFPDFSPSAPLAEVCRLVVSP